MAIIYAPNKDYSGATGPVQFVRGVGETNDAHLIAWFKSHGYQVAEDPAPPETPAAKAPVRKKKGE